VIFGAKLATPVGMPAFSLACKIDRFNPLTRI
jgi:hypothetical protein